MSGRIENMAVIDVKIMKAYEREITNPQVMYDLIVEAITEWVETTEAGRKEWKASSNDFNVGDLANVPEDLLKPFLNSRGIESIEVETAATNQINYYDQILCEAN
jgi:hypothetical protein